MILPRRALAVLVLTALAGASGCGGDDDEPGGDRSQGLAFEYEGRKSLTFTDQNVVIFSDYKEPVAPVLEYTPLDERGEEIPGLRVSTAFGSDRGGLVVIPPSGNEVLVFSGPRERDVRDVRVTVRQVQRVQTAPVSQEVTARALRGNRPVADSARFDRVRLQNPNDEAALVRVVHLVFEPIPPDPLSQQAISVTEAVPPTRVPANGEIVVPASPRARAVSERFDRGPAAELAVHPARSSGL